MPCDSPRPITAIGPIIAFLGIPTRREISLRCLFQQKSWSLRGPLENIRNGIKTINIEIDKPPTCYECCEISSGKKHTRMTTIQVEVVICLDKKKCHLLLVVFVSNHTTLRGGFNEEEQLPSPEGSCKKGGFPLPYYNVM